MRLVQQARNPFPSPHPSLPECFSSASALSPAKRSLVRARAEESTVELDAREEQPLPPLEASARRGGAKGLEAEVPGRYQTVTMKMKIQGGAGVLE